MLDFEDREPIDVAVGIGLAAKLRAIAHDVQEAVSIEVVAGSKRGLSFLVNAGMPMEQVQKVLRHENIETTQRIYADVQTATVRRGFEEAIKRVRGLT